MVLSLALLALVGGAKAQSPADAPPPSQTFSVNPDLPQTAALGPQGFTIPSLSAITSGAPTDATVALFSTAAPGATPPVSGAPPVPTFAGHAGYPPLDKIPDTNSPEVQGWIKSINWGLVPNYTQTTGDCAGSPGAQDDGRCWWTCGGCTRETDITTCPDKLTWGLSYDDGPSPYTPLLLDYLEQQKVKSTFFLVGSRVISRPEMVVTEYMSGHQLSIHTWSHHALTTLTNEQIVAELGWTAKAIRDVVGVTPNTFRPPYGDIDDRVRAIAAQMGFTPIMWSSVGTVTFDTDDWLIPGGNANGPSSLSKFQSILDDYAQKIDTGFIVLEHDLYSQTVDLAVGYFLPLAIASGKYALKSIIDCLHLPISEAYIETSSNQTSTQKLSPTGSGTVFQPSVGTNQGPAPTTDGNTGGSTGGSTSGDVSSPSSAQTGTAQPSGNNNSSGFKTAVPIAAAFAAALAVISLA